MAQPPVQRNVFSIHKFPRLRARLPPAQNGRRLPAVRRQKAQGGSLHERRRDNAQIRPRPPVLLPSRRKLRGGNYKQRLLLLVAPDREKRMAAGVGENREEAAPYNRDLLPLRKQLLRNGQVRRAQTPVRLRERRALFRRRRLRNARCRPIRPDGAIRPRPRLPRVLRHRNHAEDEVANPLGNDKILARLRNVRHFPIRGTVLPVPHAVRPARLVRRERIQGGTVGFQDFRSTPRLDKNAVPCGV